MHQRPAQICSLDTGGIGQYGLKLVQRQGYGHDGRRPLGGERRGNIGNNRKGWVRVQRENAANRLSQSGKLRKTAKLGVEPMPLIRV